MAGIATAKNGALENLHAAIFGGSKTTWYSAYLLGHEILLPPIRGTSIPPFDKRTIRKLRSMYLESGRTLEMGCLSSAAQALM
jgi:hypothetical protein